jgi:hypothetical protein
MYKIAPLITNGMILAYIISLTKLVAGAAHKHEDHHQQSDE